MIRHVCMFTLKDEGREANLREFCERAQALRGIEGVRSFAVVRNAQGTPASNYDVALVMDFDNVADLDAYQKSPVHVAFGEFVYTVRVDRACIDYEV